MVSDDARAEMRLAEEYDEAQARGEVAGHGRSKVEPVNVTTAADLGLRRDEIHEARKLRDAERADPGVIQRAIDRMVDRGEEPTRAKGCPVNRLAWAEVQQAERWKLETTFAGFHMGQDRGVKYRVSAVAGDRTHMMLVPARVLARKGL